MAGQSRGGRWRQAMEERYSFEPHEAELLEEAARALDRADEAQRALAKYGLLVEGRSGLRPNPAAIIARDSSTVFGRCVSRLEVVDATVVEPPVALRRRRAA